MSDQTPAPLDVAEEATLRARVDPRGVTSGIVATEYELRRLLATLDAARTDSLDVHTDCGLPCSCYDRGFDAAIEAPLHD